MADETGARFVPVEGIYDATADIFAPCALGQILNEETIPRLKGRLVSGGANNQLRSPRDGDALLARGITYVPDYVANAGGVLSGAGDLLLATIRQTIYRRSLPLATRDLIVRRSDLDGHAGVIGAAGQ